MTGIITDKKFKTVMLASIVMSLIAHSFRYFNAAYGLDNVTISSVGSVFSFTNAKWLLSASWVLSGFQSVPWLDGMISMLLISFSVYMLIAIFKIENRLNIWIVAGICQTSPSIIASNTYGGAYTFYVALFFGVLGAYIAIQSDEFDIRRMTGSIICIMLSAAVYGSYVEVTPE